MGDLPRRRPPQPLAEQGEPPACTQRARSPGSSNVSRLARPILSARSPQDGGWSSSNTGTRPHSPRSPQRGQPAGTQSSAGGGNRWCANCRSCAAVGGTGRRQCGQRRCSRRCPITKRSAALIWRPVRPRSSSRETVPRALRVWSVARMRWPVSTASTQVCATAGSRISPRRINT